MKKFTVEMTKQENGYCFTGEWDSDFLQDYVEAEDEDEAIEFAKDYLNEHEADADNYIFRAREKTE